MTVDFDQTHLEAIIQTNALVQSICIEVKQAREDRVKSIDLLTQRLDNMQEFIETLNDKTTDLAIRTGALEICGKPIPHLEERVAKLEWAWIKIAGFATGLSILTGMITAWIIVYLPRWLAGMKGGGGL